MLSETADCETAQCCLTLAGRGGTQAATLAWAAAFRASALKALPAMSLAAMGMQAGVAFSTPDKTTLLVMT